jgi:uncharacterized protein with von Willebrand factor type A (vWA) domain
MAQNMEAMQSLLNSMSEEMRQELQGLMQGLFADPHLQQAFSELMQHLQAYMQQHELGDPLAFHGDESLSLQEALHLIERLQGMERLEETLERVLWGAESEQIDDEQVRELMGEEAHGQVQALKDMAENLERQGYIRKSRDKLELTARGIRKIAQRAMQDIFASLRRDQFGKHNMTRRGYGGQRLEETKPYEFGDPFDVHLPRTVMNAVQRTAAQTPLRLQPQDFEVYSSESLSRCATVLLLDMSGSMERFSRFAAAKKVALALDALIRLQFPRDTLHIVGFFTYAQEIKLRLALPETQTIWIFPLHVQRHVSQSHGVSGSGTQRRRHRQWSARRATGLHQYPGGSAGRLAHLCTATNDEQAGHPDHRRRTYGPYQGQQNLPGISPLAAHAPRNAQRGQTLYASGRHHQHLHAGARLLHGALCHRIDPD